MLLHSLLRFLLHSFRVHCLPSALCPLPSAVPSPPSIPRANGCRRQSSTALAAAARQSASVNASQRQSTPVNASPRHRCHRCHYGTVGIPLTVPALSLHVIPPALSFTPPCHCIRSLLRFCLLLLAALSATRPGCSSHCTHSDFPSLRCSVEVSCSFFPHPSLLPPLLPRRLPLYFLSTPHLPTSRCLPPPHLLAELLHLPSLLRHCQWWRIPRITGPATGILPKSPQRTARHRSAPHAPQRTTWCRSAPHGTAAQRTASLLA
ncbi:unnamed protein product [Closterium sp. NIES-54]